MTWLDRVHELDALDVARALGVPPGRSERVLAQCPSCGAEQRSRSDRRAPVDVDRRKGAWHCKACGAGGGVLDLAAHRLDGAAFRDLSDAGKDRVHDWFADRFGLPSRHGGTVGGTKTAPVTPRPLPNREPDPPPMRPPAAEVEALWNACRSVTDDAEVAAWLAEERGIDPERVMLHDLARALPPDVPTPAWAGTARGSWGSSGHRLILRALDATGRPVSLRARFVGKGKALPPTGFEIGGAVLANTRARWILRQGTAPETWPRGTPLEVWIAEGEPDWLSIATAWAENDAAYPAVFGIWSGSWRPEVAARIPRRARVIVATDADEQGERYAHEIRATLAGRCEVRRWTAERAAREVVNG